jgi:hypothetical protein
MRANRLPGNPDGPTTPFGPSNQWFRNMINNCYAFNLNSY